MCPFTVGTVLWQGHDGAWTLTTCVKGTFTLVHGRDALIAEHQEPVGVDRYFAGSGASLFAPSDVVPYKPRTDIMLVGHAYAPGGRPVEALVARFSIGDVSKSIGVIGDRVWTEGHYGLEPSHPAPFTRMPLRYERAARALTNPIGVDLAAPPQAGARALPNLEATDDDAAHTATIGFGPIAPGWTSRKNVLKGAALEWVIQGGRGPVPEGFDFSFYNAAPRDQQVDLLRQGAKIVLENLNPDHARLETRLPQLRPKAFLIDRATQRGSEVALRCDTVWIDTDRAQAVVTWRGLTGVESGDARALGTIAVAAELRGKELRFKHVERLLREEGLTSADTESFAMTDVNPLNVRYDGLTLATIPQTADDPPGPPAVQAAPPPPPPPPIAAPPPTPDAVDDPTFSELTTQRIQARDQRLAKAAAIAAQKASPSTAPSDPNGEAGGDLPTAKLELPGSSRSSAPPPSPRAESADAGEPDDNESDAETARIRLKPVQRALLAASAQAPAPSRGPGTPRPAPRAPAAAKPGATAGAARPQSPRPAPTPEVHRPAMVTAPPKATTAPSQPPPVGSPSASAIPRPAMVSPAKRAADAAADLKAAAPRSTPSPAAPREAPSVGLEDFARIVVAVERGDLTAVKARLGLVDHEIELVRAGWAERLRVEPRLAEALDEAVESARWE